MELAKRCSFGRQILEISEQHTRALPASEGEKKQESTEMDKWNQGIEKKIYSKLIFRHTFTQEK